MKKLLTTILMLITCSVGYAQTWIDVTDAYIKNPRFDNNDYSDWEGNAFTGFNPKENAEHWNMNYDTYQYMSGLPAGKYRVSLNAFYRMGSYSDDYYYYSRDNYQDNLLTELYAESSVNNYMTKVVPLSSAALSYTADGNWKQIGNGLYVPDNMIAAAYCFEQGLYLNTLEIEVGSDGELKLGVRNYNHVNNDWICLDNWKLEISSTSITKITSFNLKSTSLKLSSGENYKLDATVLPSNATIKSYTWSSSNTNVATVDNQGNIHALNAGTAVITAKTVDGSNKSSSCMVTVITNLATSESMIINEIMSANVDMFIDPSWNYGAWIELYNPTNQSSNIANYYVSDDPANLKKAHIKTEVGNIPANGYRTLWFEHTEVSKDASAKYVNTQLDMELDCDGGTIYISDSEGNIIVQQDYPASIARCSYARKTDGTDEWEYSSTPTPDATNNGSSFSSKRLSAPEVDTDGKIFTDGGFTFNVKIPSGATLVYTTDGTTPSKNNGDISTTGNFTVDATTVYRFCLIKDGYLPSPVVTRSFIYKNHEYYLPVISVVTNPANLYDSTIGVFTMGSNGKTGNGRSEKCNWNMDWERPVNMEYLVPDQQGEYCVALNQECNFEICGGWSRSMYGGYDCMVDGHYWELQSSFRLKGSKMYEGVKYLDYPVFPNKPYNKYKVWQVRNGGNDSHRIYDAALGQFVIRSGFNVDVQDCQPAHVFLNGDYLGMLNIRESNNKHYGFSSYGIDTDDMDQFDLSNAQYNQKAGDDQAWLHLVDLSVQLANNNSAATYAEICELLDIDEYCNYMALECFLGSSDWITNTNNVKGFRSRSDGGKFHFVFFDCDAGYENDNMTSSLMYGSYNANVDDLFRNLIQYEPFKQQFITAFCIVDGSVLDPDRCEAITTEMYNRANKALGFEGKSSNTWIASRVRDNHNSNRINNLRGDFGLSAPYEINLSANIESAQLMYNGQEIPYASLSGKLFAPITLTAKAPAGYTFKGWKQEGSSSGVETKESVFDECDNWYYYDQGSLDSDNWTSLDYAHSSFAYSQAPFGYAKAGKFMDTNSHTTLNYGSDSGNKRPTYYFIHHFNIDQLPANNETYRLTYKVDDGARFHVNGVDFGGYHCDQGATYGTYSTTYEADDPYVGTIDIPSKHLKVGDNVIAVDVHNISANSSDIYFDANLYKSIIEEGENYYLCTDETFCLSDLEDAGSYTIQAVFEPISDTATRLEKGGSPIRINEVSSANDIYINEYFKKADWIELYNTTDKDIDLEGMYLSDNSAKPQKYQISASGDNVSTVIPAFGRKIIWCDKTDASTQLHAPFKLDNADGAIVSIQAEDGTWADEMTYMAQERWKTYGRYPDGGNMLTVLGHPTINKSNRLGTYDYENDTPSIWEDDQFAITLALEKGWNWISHNLTLNVDKSRFTSYAQSIRSQSNELYNDEKLGWVGNISTLNATEGYKVNMNDATDITLRGNLFDVNTPVSVKEGWNWIGVPLYNATTLTAALKNYQATEGDVISGLDGFATYEGGNWEGSLTSLSPGRSYLLKSGNAQSFCWNSLSTPVNKVRRYVAPQNETMAPWTFDKHAYPNVMNIVGHLEVNGLEAEGNYWLGAFCCGECRGVAEQKDGLLYLTIHTVGGEKLNFRVIDSNGHEYDVEQQLNASAQTIVGSRKAPYVFSVSDATAVSDLASLASHVVSTVYYNTNGQRIYAPQNGIYIKKTIYNNGFEKIEKLNK